MTHSVVYVSVCVSLYAGRDKCIHVPMSNVDVLNNVEANARTHTHLIQIRAHTNNRSIFFSTLPHLYFRLGTIVYSMIIIAIQPEAKSNKFTERNLEGIEEKWHIFCHSSFPLCCSPQYLGTLHIHTSLRQILYILYNKNKSRTSVSCVLPSLRFGEMGFFFIWTFAFCCRCCCSSIICRVFERIYFFYFHFLKYDALVPPLVVPNHGCHGARFMLESPSVYIYMGECVCARVCELKFICRQ